MVIAATSTQYINVTVTQTNKPPVDVQGTEPEFAFLATLGNPGDDDWKTGEWDPNSTNDIARILVGPAGGTLSLDPGRYRVWVKVAGGAETLVMLSGMITVI